jgi:hypothetical protein
VVDSDWWRSTACTVRTDVPPRADLQHEPFHGDVAELLDVDLGHVEVWLHPLLPPCGGVAVHVNGLSEMPWLPSGACPGERQSLAEGEKWR